MIQKGTANCIINLFMTSHNKFKHDKDIVLGLLGLINLLCSGPPFPVYEPVIFREIIHSNLPY